jgi:type IV pilus assembly protein PilE
MKKYAIVGFTLIELMIVVAILCILAMIAYPSYTKWTIEARRADGKAALARFTNDLEKFYSECGAYTKNITATTRSCTAPAGPPAGSLGRGAAGNLSPNGSYSISIQVPADDATIPAGGYRILATPVGDQTADKECNVLRIDNTGTTSATGAGTKCWKK